MATNSTPLTNLSGLSSGIDTNALVTQLVAIRKQPALLLNDQINLIDARKNGFQSASNVLTALKTAATDLSSSSLWTSSQSVVASNQNVLSVSRSSATAPGGYMLSVLSLARAEQQRSSTSFSSAGSDDVLRISVGSGEVKTVSISSGDNLGAISTKINQSSDMGVYASVLDGRLYLSSKTTGAANTISVTSQSTLADDMGLSVYSSASDATYTVNGGAVQSSATNTVKTAVPGLSIVFKQTGDSGITVGDSTVSADAIADKIGALVTAYNNAGKSLKDSVSTQPVKNPTTNSEKMQGAMFNNRTLQSALTDMRSWYSHTSSASGGASLFQSLGIKTQVAGSASSLSGNPQLTFDRQTFLDAYAADPEKAKKMVSNLTNDASSEGLSQWVQRQVNNMVGAEGIITTAAKGQDSQRKTLVERQDRINQRATVYETFLRQQYTHMETILGTLQSQNSQLAGQIKSITG